MTEEGKAELLSFARYSIVVYAVRYNASVAKEDEALFTEAIDLYAKIKNTEVTAR